MKAWFFTSYNDNNVHKLHVAECLRQSGYDTEIVTVVSEWDKMRAFLRSLAQQDLVVVWNGSEPGCDWMMRLCQNYGIPHLVAERGLLPQQGYWHLDRTGIVGDSSLCGSLGWVTPEMQAAYQSYRERYLAEKGYRYVGGGGFTLCPLQLWWDTAIYLHSPFKSMDEFLTVIRQRVTGRIIATVHPLVGKCETAVAGVEVVKASTMELAQQAEAVYGINSTVLAEIAMLVDHKCPINAFGRCPLYYHGSDIPTLLAALHASQIPIGKMDVKQEIQDCLARGPAARPVLPLL